MHKCDSADPESKILIHQLHSLTLVLPEIGNVKLTELAGIAREVSSILIME